MIWYQCSWNKFIFVWKGHFMASVCWSGYIHRFRWDVLMAFLLSKTKMTVNSLGQMWWRKASNHPRQLVLFWSSSSFSEVFLLFLFPFQLICCLKVYWCFGDMLEIYLGYCKFYSALCVTSFLNWWWPVWFMCMVVIDFAPHCNFSWVWVAYIQKGN